MIVLAVLAISLSASGYYFIKLRRFNTITVKKSDIYKDISVQGRVIAADNIDLGFDTDGKISSIDVKKGDKVSFQDKLAQLDTARSQAEIKQYQAKVELDKLKLSQLLSGTSAEEISLLESKAESAKVGLDSARQESADVKLKTENDLAEQYALARDYSETVLLYADNAIKALDGIYTEQNKFGEIFIIPDSQKRSEAEWQIMLAKSAFKNIRSTYDALKSDSSYQNIDIALSQFKTNLEVIRSSLQKTAEIFDVANMIFGAPDIATFKTTVAVQRSNINSTQTAILTMEQNIASLKITAQVETNKAQSDIENMELALKTAEKELALKKTAPQEIDLGVYQAQIKENEAYLEVLNNKLKNSTLKAPADGIISGIRKHYDVTVKSGEPVLSLIPFSDVQIEATASPGESAMIKAGDEASVFLNGAVKKGKVVGVNNKKISIYLQEKTEGAVSGDEAEVKIRAVLKNGIILVPKEFIFEEGGIKKVNLVADNRKKAVAVLTGSEWNGQIEIQEGVSEGDVLAE